jgi:eukaryotic-like serine/threonine-protein kinase
LLRQPIVEDSSAPKPNLGKYRVVRRIGEGSMGTVFRAHDPSLERDVAIKVMSGSSVHDPKQRERFEREAKAVARLHHPNIVTVHDLGYDAEGSPFIAMEFLEGADLHDLTATATLTVGRKLEIVIQVARGLAHAHEAGIVHRDIKPANVFVLLDGTAKIMDFGVSRWLRTHQTQAGLVVGTAGYISPEQLRGKPVDGRADVFSLGVVLYETLTHDVLFEGDSVETIFFKTLGREPPVLVTPDGSEVPALQAIVKRALAKEVETRFRTAADMADALEAFLASRLDLMGATFAFATRERAVTMPSTFRAQAKAPTRVVAIRPTVVPTRRRTVKRGRRGSYRVAIALGCGITILASALGLYSLLVARPVTSSAPLDPPTSTPPPGIEPAPPATTENVAAASPELQADAALAIARGKLDEARRLIERGERLDPDNPRFRALREQLRVQVREAERRTLATRKVEEGGRYLTRGDARRAVDAYTEALQVDPANAAARNGLDRALGLASPTPPPAPEVRPATPPRTFVEGRTVFTPGKPSGDELMGFEAEPGIEVGETTDAIFPAQVILDLDPQDAKPGDPFAIRVSLFNEGYRPIRIGSLELVSRFGDRATGNGQLLALSADEVPPQTTILLHEIRGTWKESLNEGALEATVTLAEGGSLKKTLRW